MLIKVIASGSTGNCYRITDGKTVIMIEAGIRFKLIQQAFDFKLHDVAGCLLSHEHGDHAKSVKDIMKAGIDCFMSPGTAKALKLSGHRLKTVSVKQIFTIGTFKILPFEAQHDCAEPFGYLIQSGSEKLLFLTDSYYCKYRFTCVTHFLIEANYCKKILEENIESGRTPAFIKHRLLKSHFEIENVKEFFRVNDMSACKEIYLIHMSKGNADPELFKNEIQKITGKPVYTT